MSGTLSGRQVMRVWPLLIGSAWSVLVAAPAPTSVGSRRVLRRAADPTTDKLAQVLPRDPRRLRRAGLPAPVDQGRGRDARGVDEVPAEPDDGATR